jgi:hypothetical protein
MHIIIDIDMRSKRNAAAFIAEHRQHRRDPLDTILAARAKAVEIIGNVTAYPRPHEPKSLLARYSAVRNPGRLPSHSPFEVSQAEAVIKVIDHVVWSPYQDGNPRQAEHAAIDKVLLTSLTKTWMRNHGEGQRGFTQAGRLADLSNVAAANRMRKRAARIMSWLQHEYRDLFTQSRPRHYRKKPATIAQLLAAA